MANFYLLPPRAEVARRFADFLQTWFPGMPEPGDEAADDLAAVAMRYDAAYVVYADELAGAADLPRTLAADFGAEEGDRVVDLRAGPALGTRARVRVLTPSPLRRSA